MNDNAVFRRWPLNYHNTATTVGPHNVGVLHGVRPTPPQYGGENNIAARREFWRVNQVKPTPEKWIPVASSSDVIAAKKRLAIGKGTFYSPDGAFSTKRANTNDVKQTLTRVRSSGSVAPAKKGAVNY